jgi:PII-like signaling protein
MEKRMLEVTIFLDEDDIYQGKPLHEHIMHHLMHHQIAGATIFAGMGGYGHKRHLHYPKKIGAADEAPLMIVFIDEESKVHTVLPHLKEVVREGLIIVKKAERA